MKSILALLIGVTMGADTDITTSDQAKIKSLYDGLVNKGGSEDLNTWMNNFAKENFKSCYMNFADRSNPQWGVWQCTSQKENPFDLDEYIEGTYFSDKQSLTSQDCKITSKTDKNDYQIDCNFQFNGQSGCFNVNSQENLKYDETGSDIHEYHMMTMRSQRCESNTRRLSGSNYWPTKKPVDDNNYPCTAENIAANKFYHPSPSGCCNFIQCDEHGMAHDMPCGAGTYWDQQLLTCDHNYGQCMDDTCRDPTPQPTPAPVKSTYTKKPTPGYGDNKCYNTRDKNPCTAENTALNGYHFASCDSCCQFIQCDDFGVAYSRPCPAGTYWDDKVKTCNHNDNGQCKDDKCKMATPSPTKAWTTKAPTKAWTTKAPTTTKKPTPAPTKAWTTKAPTKAWTTKKPTPSPTKAWTTKAPTTTKKPTPAPTKWTTKSPTKAPTTKKPTPAPTKWTTKSPTKSPTTTKAPTKTPTDSPTKAPTTTKAPTKMPTDSPTKMPTDSPTKTPTTTWAPTKTPTDSPTKSPTTTKAPTKTPTTTKMPTKAPSQTWTTKAPTKKVWPTAKPTPSPTKSQNPWKH